MIVTFEQSTKHSAYEFLALKQRAEYPELFDCAVNRMLSENWKANIKTGVTRNRSGVMSYFPNYNGLEDYAEYKNYSNLIFYDFFRGFLMNYYSRLVRGIYKA